MVRTQVYLTEGERDGLAALAKQTGRPQSELIREAVDLLLAQANPARARSILKETAGMWKGRKDLPSFKTLRKDWDR